MAEKRSEGSDTLWEYLSLFLFRFYPFRLGETLPFLFLLVAFLEGDKCKVKQLRQCCRTVHCWAMRVGVGWEVGATPFATPLHYHNFHIDALCPPHQATWTNFSLSFARPCVLGPMSCVLCLLYAPFPSTLATWLMWLGAKQMWKAQKSTYWIMIGRRKNEPPRKVGNGFPISPPLRFVLRLFRELLSSLFSAVSSSV